MFSVKSFDWLGQHCRYKDVDNVIAQWALIRNVIILKNSRDMRPDCKSFFKKNNVANMGIFTATFLLLSGWIYVLLNIFYDLFISMDVLLFRSPVSEDINIWSHEGVL